MKKIKQIELKDVNLEKLYPDEVYMCILDDVNMCDLFFEQIDVVLDYIRRNKEVVFFKVEKDNDQTE